MGLWSIDHEEEHRQDINLFRTMKRLTAISKQLASCNWHQQVLRAAVKQMRLVQAGFILSLQSEISIRHLANEVNERLSFLDAIYDRNKDLYVTRQAQVKAQVHTACLALAVNCDRCTLLLSLGIHHDCHARQYKES